MKIARIPTVDRTNGWSAYLPPRTPRPSLNKDVAVDWVVLGAGYAGLAAARRLAENCPDQHIGLIDAGQAGENASGRNSGFAIDLPHNVGSSLDELEGSHRFMRLARLAIDQLQGIVCKHDIQCDWSLDGRYHTAVSARGVKTVLEPYAAELKALGEPFEWLDKDQVRAKIGSDHFTAAVFTPGGALMNPAALTRGLADSLPDNVTLFENSPVTEAHFQNGVHLTTAQGSLRGPKMILCANGYTEHFGFLANRFLHLFAHGSLTRRLTKAEQAAYGVDAPWGLTPANAFAGITMRYTNDRRILIRQGLGYCPAQKVSLADQAKVNRHHKKLLDARFPMLSGVEIENTWTGIVCLSQNAAPAFGRLAPNIYSAACQNAVGVTKGTFAGMLVADLATEQDNPLISDMMSLGEPSALPPRPFLDVGVRARFAWELWKNRDEA